MSDLTNDVHPTPKKEAGFAGQKMIVLPQKVIEQIKRDKLLNTFFLTHIGYFPKAKFHYRERKKGINEYILIHCVGGNGWYDLEGERVLVGPNELFILPPGIPHRYSADEHTPWSIYWIHFTGSMAQTFITSFNPDKAVHHFIPSINERIQIFEEMYNALERGYSTDNLGYANTCLWHFMGSLRFSNTYKRLKSQTGNNDIVEESISFMKKNIHKSLSLEGLAQNVHYSVSYYSTLFKDETGYSPIDYLIHLKIQKACQFLDLTNLNVNEIALKVGYADNLYFSRLFRKVMGLSPTEYRKKQKG